MTATAEPAKEMHNNIFQRIMSSFSNLWVPLGQASDSLLVHFELRYEMLDMRALRVLNDRKRLLLRAGFQVTEKELQEQISPEYIGRVSYWNEGKLESQNYLQIQVKYIEKMRIVFLPISPLVVQDQQAVADSKNFP